MTSKQALKELKNRAEHDEYLFRNDTDTEKATRFLRDNEYFFNIIEQELKESENYQVIYRLEHEKNQHLTQANLKMSKALEIIKNKGVFVHLLQQSKNVEEYNSLMLIAFKKMAERDYKGAIEKFCLTQEEYDLLKEELL